MRNIYFILFTSLLFPQIDYNFSFEFKFAKDSNATYKDPTFFENILDINLYVDDLYIFTQFEYSMPPLVGENRTTLSDALNIIYLEYFNDKFDITLGNLFGKISNIVFLLFRSLLEQITFGGLYIFHNLILFSSFINFFPINILSLRLTLILGFSHNILFI